GGWLTTRGGGSPQNERIARGPVPASTVCRYRRTNLSAVENQRAPDRVGRTFLVPSFTYKAGRSVSVRAAAISMPTPAIKPSSATPRKAVGRNAKKPDAVAAAASIIGPPTRCPV